MKRLLGTVFMTLFFVSAVRHCERVMLEREATAEELAEVAMLLEENR